MEMSALLFVPATDEHKIQKAETLGCSGIILDLEDAVSEADKERARANATRWLQQRASDGPPRRWVRINGLDTPHSESDLDAVLPASPDGFVVPKVERAGQLRALEDRLRRWERETGQNLNGIQMVILLETAAGVMRMEELLSASKRIRAAALGIADLAVDTGMSLDFAFRQNGFAAERVRLVLVSRALGLEPPWDVVYVFLDDKAGFREDVHFGHDIGCQGKMVIHPSQLAVVREVYGVSDEEMLKARRILEISAQARQSGQGAVLTEDGLLVDGALVRWAEDTLRRAGEQ
ncbi:conserved protein of unknown function [Kyrpidia spormannii]|uniref:HpcH/HpaI aldolase/citrate lyase domain-containing protein n=2 Tax=Kyrpidia spormannii TaxID=2055160 RepID=A0A6F9EBF6_9BACL|nr:conserved protein of unknown function [Kyrpidia spormannii]